MKINMDVKDVARRLRDAMFYMNTAYILADVIHSYMLEAESLISPLREGLTQSNKMRFNKCLKIVGDAKRSSMAIAEEIYKVDSVDEACEDSDFLAESVYLLVSKTMYDNEAKRKVTEFLRELPDINPKKQ